MQYDPVILKKYCSLPIAEDQESYNRDGGGGQDKSNSLLFL